MKLKDRIKSFRRVAAKDLLPNPKNWRTHPEAQANALRGVLAENERRGSVELLRYPDSRLDQQQE